TRMDRARGEAEAVATGDIDRVVSVEERAEERHAGEGRILALETVCAIADEAAAQRIRRCTQIGVLDYEVGDVADDPIAKIGVVDEESFECVLRDDRLVDSEARRGDGIDFDAPRLVPDHLRAREPESRLERRRHAAWRGHRLRIDPAVEEQNPVAANLACAVAVKEGINEAHSGKGRVPGGKPVAAV